MEDAERVDTVLGLLGKSWDDETTSDLAAQHLPLVMAVVRAYTRGAGFTDNVPASDIEAVLATVTARLIRNPPGIHTNTVGPFAVQYEPTVQGFSLLELVVLNRYRRRAA